MENVIAYILDCGIAYGISYLSIQSSNIKKKKECLEYLTPD